MVQESACLALGREHRQSAVVPFRTLHALNKCSSYALPEQLYIRTNTDQKKFRALFTLYSWHFLGKAGVFTYFSAPYFSEQLFNIHAGKKMPSRLP
ncbi:hypothetical protein BN2475_420017 [Paraburkholderia ribeironis]|uniref:Uncharacterized protein n=1 Tax=Paraburkholderia ribeironis TaxID=1247936 RepID=A0A1N7S766_9BURK|nr:hypothetical protein BN2475_420017 [Paraburkholderia ribeironis]